MFIQRAACSAEPNVPSEWAQTFGATAARATFTARRLPPNCWRNKSAVIASASGPTFSGPNAAADSSGENRRTFPSPRRSQYRNSRIPFPDSLQRNRKCSRVGAVGGVVSDAAAASPEAASASPSPATTPARNVAAQRGQGLALALVQGLADRGRQMADQGNDTFDRRHAHGAFATNPEFRPAGATPRPLIHCLTPARGGCSLRPG